MLGKILLLVLAIWLVLVLLKQYRRGVDSPRESAPPNQDMVRCPVCEVHLPKAESLEKNGRHYCCPEHRDQADS